MKPWTRRSANRPRCAPLGWRIRRRLRTLTAIREDVRADYAGLDEALDALRTDRDKDRQEIAGLRIDAEDDRADVAELREEYRRLARDHGELRRQVADLLDVAPLLLAAADVQGLARQLHGLSDGAREAGVPYPDPVDERLVAAGLANQGDSHRGPTLTHAGLIALQAYDQLHQAF